MSPTSSWFRAPIRALPQQFVAFLRHIRSPISSNVRRLGRRAVPVSAAASAVALFVAIGLGGQRLWSAPGSVRQSAPGPNAMVVFGPQRFSVERGRAIHIERFSLDLTTDQRYTLAVQNGAGDGSRRVRRGTIRLNGREVISRDELGRRVGEVVRVVDLEAENTLHLELRGRTCPVWAWRVSVRAPATIGRPSGSYSYATGRPARGGVGLVPRGPRD